MTPHASYTLNWDLGIELSWPQMNKPKIPTWVGMESANTWSLGPLLATTCWSVKKLHVASLRRADQQMGCRKQVGQSRLREKTQTRERCGQGRNGTSDGLNFVSRETRSWSHEQVMPAVSNPLQLQGTGWVSASSSVTVIRDRIPGWSDHQSDPARI